MNEICVTIDPGTAPKEVIEELLADLSILYKLEGGSGITFEFLDALTPKLVSDE